MSRRRSYRKAQHRDRKKSGKRSSSASKGAPKAASESGAQMLSESVDVWAQFRRCADEAATTSWKAKSLGKKGGGSSEGQGGPNDSKSSASSVAKFGSEKGSKRTGEEAGLTTKFPNDQRQIPASVPRLKPLINLIKTGITGMLLPQESTEATEKKKAAENGLSSTLTKGRILRSRLGEGLQLSTHCLRQTYRSATGLTIAQGTTPYPLTLSALSGRLAWCSFEAPGTTPDIVLRQSSRLGIRLVTSSDCGAWNS